MQNNRGRKPTWLKFLLGYGAVVVAGVALHTIGSAGGTAAALVLAAVAFVGYRYTRPEAKAARVGTCVTSWTRHCPRCGWAELRRDVEVCRACGRHVGVDELFLAEKADDDRRRRQVLHTARSRQAARRDRIARLSRRLTGRH